MNMEPFLTTLGEDLFASDIEKIMKEHCKVQPPGSLEPKHIWEEKIRRGLMDIATGKGASEKATSGFDAIAADLKGHLSPIEMKKIQQEWEQGIRQWKDSQGGSCLAEALGISEETLVRFYEAASHYFEAGHFSKASDAFYVISVLDARRHNVWVALALSEMNLSRWNSAIICFAMASLTDGTAPLPYLYSAECCLNDHRKGEAEVYLELAKNAMSTYATKEEYYLLNKIKGML